MRTTENKLTKTAWTASSYWETNPKSIAVLVVSLLLFGFGEGLLVLAALGSTPWTVLAQGITLKTGINIGVTTLLISLAVMLTWIPFNQKVGLGTVLNVLIIALGLGLTAEFVTAPTSLIVRYAFSLSGILIIGICSAFYLTCHMGAGPRDGLMVGIYEATGWKIGIIRTAIEGSACFIGWLLGGVVGISTLLFALGVGWVLQIALVVIANIYNTASNPMS